MALALEDALGRVGCKDEGEVSDEEAEADACVVVRLVGGPGAQHTPERLCKRACMIHTGGRVGRIVVRIEALDENPHLPHILLQHRVRLVAGNKNPVDRREHTPNPREVDLPVGLSIRLVLLFVRGEERGGRP